MFVNEIEGGFPRVVLGDFGGAKLVRQPPGEGEHVALEEWNRVVYSDKAMAVTFNAMGQDPHVFRAYSTGPLTRSQVFLEDIFAKSDLFAVGRMMYVLLGVPVVALPMVQDGKLAFLDTEVRTWCC